MCATTTTTHGTKQQQCAGCWMREDTNAMQENINMRVCGKTPNLPLILLSVGRH
jgi:hypothetical protein